MKANFILEQDLNVHLTNSFLSIFINVATQSPKYLVLYDWEIKKQEDENGKSEETSASKAEETETGPKRIKLDHDAFLSRLK